jgi:hypothetical protein
MSNLVFGLNENGFVILGMNNYEYGNDNMVIELLKHYKKVIFDNNFNSRIDWLPEGITDLQLGMNFNQPLENLPSTIKRITIRKINDVGYTKFNQQLDYLPPGLEEIYIHFNQEFNYPLNNLPIGLKKLFLIGYNYKQPINNLPNSLEEITIKQFDYENTHKLPRNLKLINISIKKSIILEQVNQVNQVYTVSNSFTNLITLQNNFPNVKFCYADDFYY